MVVRAVSTLCNASMQWSSFSWRQNLGEAGQSFNPPLAENGSWKMKGRARRERAVGRGKGEAILSWERIQRRRWEGRARAWQGGGREAAPANWASTCSRSETGENDYNRGPSRAKANVAFSHFLHVILSIIGANSLSSDLMFFSQCIPG